MAIEFDTFTAKAPTLRAIFVTSDILDELAALIGADSYNVRTQLKGNKKYVEFAREERKDTQRTRLRTWYDNDRVFARVEVGQYLAWLPARVDHGGSELEDSYYTLTVEEMEKFRLQAVQGPVDISAAPYDR